ncbi:MAG: SPOR domain-containing protein [Acidobacteriaceae bacterium]
MNPLLDEDDDDLQRTERELTLSTGMILVIFLVLVVLCGAFFGFGYKMGGRNKIPLPVSATAVDGSQPSTNFNSFKPAAGSPAGEAPANTPAETGGESPSAGTTPAPAVVNPAGTEHGATPTVTTTERPAAEVGIMVQVAAVSHEEDAQLLVNALKAKGYPVSAHTEPADKFFHIQVGPFTSMKDATAAKQRLVADGYQPIIK